VSRRIQPGRLANGWSGPDGTTLRLARPGEADEVARLAESTGGPLEEWMHAAIEDGTASSALVDALRTGPRALTLPVARFLTGGDLMRMTELALALVAESEGRIVGALYALPPGAFIAQCVEQGIEPAHAMAAAVGAAKIKALAVDPDRRGHGIATALLAGCMRLYDQLGFHLLYGQFAAGSGLGSFYSARGFEIAPLGQGISMWVILGRNAVLGADENEQLFARWR
jgi:GNAT superfamily N-acetyltransferase